MPLQNLDNEMHRRCANSPVREPAGGSLMTSSNHTQNPTTEQSPRLIPANSPTAYALWARRVGLPLYTYTQERSAWAVRCPSCGQLVLLEVVFDSEMGGYFMPEACACGGGL